MAESGRNRGAWLIGTWFGCGYFPKGPGTAGSLGAVAVALVSIASGFPPLWFVWLALGSLPLAVWAAGVVARESGRKDPQIVVVDEVVGQWLTLAGASRFNWRSIVFAFLLFRLFDILKPPPIRLLERVPGGAGIVLDDFMAGIYGALVLFLMGWKNLY